jgi:hypothetical protein
LRVYPQFGEARRDLSVGEETITVYAATFGPLVVEYLVNEARREMYIAAPVKVLPHAGFQ